MVLPVLDPNWLDVLNRFTMVSGFRDKRDLCVTEQEANNKTQ